MANRHLARSIVLQTLYEWDFRKLPDGSTVDVLHRNIKEFAPGLTDSDFLQGLLSNIISKREDIDRIIEKAAPDWPLEKIGKDIYLALVHDIFRHWTLSKGQIGNNPRIANEGVEEGTVRKIKEEIGVDVAIRADLGSNEYVASDPEEGKIRKQVHYFLAESRFVPLKLEKKGGLDDAKWFKLADILELNFYNDI